MWMPCFAFVKCFPLCVFVCMRACDYMFVCGSLYIHFIVSQNRYQNCLLYVRIGHQRTLHCLFFFFFLFLLRFCCPCTRTKCCIISIHPSIYLSLSLYLSSYVYEYILCTKWMWQLTKHRLFKLNGSIFLNFAIYLIAVAGKKRIKKEKMENASARTSEQVSEWVRASEKRNKSLSISFFIILLTL